MAGGSDSSGVDDARAAGGLARTESQSEKLGGAVSRKVAILCCVWTRMAA